MGTPTPEPPDFLRRPDAGRLSGTRETVTTTDASAVPVELRAGSGFADANAELWIVNLDRGEAPLELRADADGAFAATLRLALGDRVRVVQRTDTRHSLPLDLVYTQVGPGTGIAPLRAEALSCLRVEPDEDLTVRVRAGSDETRPITLENGCDRAVELTRAELRFGDVGFSLEAPRTVEAGARATLDVRVSGHDDPREHADIVLLDVQSGASRGRYAIGVFSIASSSIGSER